MAIPETGFIKNVNTLADKISIIEASNEIFNVDVIDVLQDIALLDLDETIQDLKKGNYLGNRKLDINLALNMIGVTEDILSANPDAAEAIWTNPAKTVQYDSATITFNDGVIIELPFIFDGNPTTVSTHADLLTQLSRYDFTSAVRQVATVSNVVALNNTQYSVTINSSVLSFTSDGNATVAEIITGLVNTINLSSVPVTAAEADLTFTLSADVPGTPFTATVINNMVVTATVDNEEAVIAETQFLAKLYNSTLASFASNVVGEIIRIYDIVGSSSNLERIQLHAVSGQFIDPNPLYFWAKTTSAFQTLSMRAGDVIKLGNDIDSIILLASRITELVDLQNKIPQLVLNGDSLYTNIAKLVVIYEQLSKIIQVYDDVKVGGTNYTNTVALDLVLVNSKIATVAADLQLGGASAITIVKNAVASVVAVANNIANVNIVAPHVASVNTNAANIVAIQNASANANTASAQANIATTQAGIATTQAGISTAQAIIATSKANSILGLTTQTSTGAAGSFAAVSYNSTDGKMTFSIPQGIQGIRGEAFTVNSVGLAADRPLYNAQIKGFSFLAIDVGLVYFKLSNATADWSIGAPFGKGDQGEIGPTGAGIISIAFLSSTHVSNLAGMSGATDTYRITLSDTTTYNFIIYNGLNGVLINDATLSLVATWSNQNISNKLALKANIDSPTFTGAVSGITAAMVGAPTGSGNSSGTNTGDQVIPTTLPASDVSAWAKAATKPVYTKTEVGLSNADNTSDATKNSVVVSLTNKTILAATNTVEATSGPNGSAFGLRNRIINGDMRIDQRNNGAAVTVTADQYVLDRFVTANTTGTGTLTAQQSTLGNSKSFKLTATAAVTDLTGVKYVHGVIQGIEAQNIVDLNSKIITISFRVETNWTGNLPVSLRNSDITRSYVVNAPVVSGINKVVVTIPLEAASVLTAGNAGGLSLAFGFNNEAAYRTATTNAWIVGNLLVSTASTQWAKTTGNFINVTDVQLEEGSVATPFERRPIGLELALCQRYLPAHTCTIYQDDIAMGPSINTSEAVVLFNYIVPPRVAPTGINISALTGFYLTTGNIHTTVGQITSIIFTSSGLRFARINITSNATIFAANQICSLYGSVGERILFTGCEL